MKQIYIYLVVIFGVYMATFFMLFVINHPAFCCDQDRTRSGQLVAFGPKVAGPYLEGVYYIGNPWPYYAYAFPCYIWRIYNEYSYPESPERRN